MELRKLLRSSLVFISLIIAASCTASEYSNPPASLTQSDLEGTWEAHYKGMATGTDILVLRADGTFKQKYDSADGFTFETPWNAWSLERFPDGRAWAHLMGARYFKEEHDSEYYDPDTNKSVSMKGELILKVKIRQDHEQDTVLQHFRTHINDVGTDDFHRTEQ